MSSLSNPDSQIRTNVTPNGVNDSNTVIAALKNGGFVSIWSSDANTDGSVTGIFGQLFDNEGVKIGAQFQVNGVTPTVNASGTSSGQNFPSVAALNDGGFVVTWESTENNPNSIMGQRYTVAGAGQPAVRAADGQIHIDATDRTTQSGASVTGLSGGGFIVTWEASSDVYNPQGPAITYDIYSRVFTAAGAPVGAGDTLVNVAGAAGTQQVNPTAAAISGTEAVIVYQSLNEDASGWGVYGQAINTTTGLTTGSRFLVNTTTAGHQFAPAITKLNDGGFVVVWTAEGQEGAGNTSLGIYGQRFDAAHTKVGTEFRVNTTVAGDQQTPSIVALTDGTFVVNWTGPSMDGTNFDVYARRFDVGAGTPTASDPDTLINQSTANNQSNGQDPLNNVLGETFPNYPDPTISVPAYAAYTDFGGRGTVAQLSDGRVVFAWHGQPDTSGQTFSEDSFARIFNIGAVDPNDAPTLLDTNVVLNAVSEDAPAPFGAVGTLVSDIAHLTAPGGGGNINDPDTNAQTGIALVGLNASAGKWWYTTDGGAHWTQVANPAAISSSSAILLGADSQTRLYLQPAANLNGNIGSAITFRAWDQTSGGNGDTGVNTTPNGGATAFSTATDTASIAVTAVNDEPTLVLTGTGASYSETVPAANGSPVLLASTVSLSDPDNTTTLLGATVKITNFVAEDELKINGSASGIINNGANGTINFSFSGNTLTLSGADTFLDYENALKLVTYDSTSADPTAGGTRMTVNIQWQVLDDGAPVALANLLTLLQPDDTQPSSVANNSYSRAPLAVQLYDLNKDGKLDLITANATYATPLFNLVVQYGNGDGTFGNADTYQINGGQFYQDNRPVSIALGNLNGDAFTDLAVSSANSNEVMVFLGTNTGKFTPAPAPSFNVFPAAYPAGFTPVSVAGANFAGDGNTDLIVLSSASFYDIAVLTGTGSGTFGAAADLHISGSGASAFAVADLNADTKSDLVVTNSSGTVFIAYGDGSGGFTDGLGNPDTAIFYSVGSAPSAVTVADLNADGLSDIVVANSGDNTVSVLLQNADHTFGPASPTVSPTYAVGSAPTAVKVADLNKDGIPDLVVSNSGSNDVSLLLGVGDGTFGAANSFAVGAGPDAIAIGTINGDSDLDVAVGNKSGQSVSILLNNTNALSNIVETTDGIAAVNNAPEVSAATTQFSGTANSAITISGGFAFSDPDGGTQTETVIFALGTGSTGTFEVAGGNATYALTNGGHVTISGSGTDTLSITGNTVDLTEFVNNGDVNSANQVTYTATSPGEIKVTIDDGGHTGVDPGLTGTATSEADTATLTIVLNSPPVVTPSNPATPPDFTERAGPIFIDSQITVTDPDNPASLATIKVAISNGYTFGDLLAADTSGTPLNATYDPNTHTLTISGPGTVAQYQQVLQTVTFDNPEVDPNNPFAGGHNPDNYGNSPTRTFTYVADDGTSPSDPATATIHIVAINEAPVLSGVNATDTYTENQNLSFDTVSAYDVDSLLGGQIKITSGGLISDRIGFGGTSGDYNDGSGVIHWTYGLGSKTFSFSTTSGNPGYSDFFASISYFSTSDDPTNGGANPTRTLEFGLTDGDKSSQTFTDVVTVVPINDSPTNILASPQAVDEDQPLSIAGLSIADPDAASNNLVTTLSTAHGTLTVLSQGGAVVSGSGTGLVTLTGTVEEINTTLGAASNVVYQGALDFNGFDQLTVITNDGGNTGGAGPSYQLFTSYTAGLGAVTIVAGDFTGDGVPDLITGNSNGTVSLLAGIGTSGNATGGFSPAVRSPVMSSVASLAAGDFNGDGKLDLAAGGDGVAILLGNGAGGFAAPAFLIGSGSFTDLHVSDFNGDGKLDLVAVEPGAGTVDVFLGTGSGTFNPETPTNAVAGATSVQIGDVDGDSVLDLVVLSPNDPFGGPAVPGEIVVLHGNGDGSFATPVDITTSGAPFSIALGDIDGDGKLDLVVSDAASGVRAQLGNGDGTFGPDSTIFFAPGWTASLGHVDGDGKLDLVVTDPSSGTSMVGLNNGGGFFNFSTQPFSLGGSAGSVFGPVVITDLNGDGAADLAVPLPDDGQVSVLLNQSLAGIDVDYTSITLAPVNDPVSATAPANLTANEEESTSIPGLSIADVDAALAPDGIYEVTISANHGTLTLGATTGLSFTGGANGTASATFQGKLGDLNTALGSATYTSEQDFNGDDTINVTVTDDIAGTLATGSGLASTGTATIAVSVVGVNDPAIIGGDITGSVTEAGGVANGTAGTPTSTGKLTDTDVDNPANTFQPVSAGTPTTNGYGTYELTAGGDWTYTLDDTNDSVEGLNGAATLTDTFTALTEDGTPQIVTVTIHAQNDAPVMDDVDAGPVGYAGTPVTVDSDVTVTDVDDTHLESATVAITDFEAEDILSVGGSQVQPENGISWSYNSGTGELLFTGHGLKEDYEALLERVQYSSSALDPGAGNHITRSITWTINDGDADNGVVPTTILSLNVPPVLDLDGVGGDSSFTTTFTEDAGAVNVVDSDVSIVDTDDGNMESATISLTDDQTGDSLSISNAALIPLGIAVDPSSTPTFIKLIGSASKADYQSALKLVVFNNSSQDPSDADRHVDIVVNDGSSNSNQATALIHVTPINDAPVNTVPGPQTVNEDTDLSISGLSVSDVDIESGNITVTLSVLHGTIHVLENVPGGLDQSDITGNDTNSVTLSCDPGFVNATLGAVGGVVYRPNQDYNGADTLTMTSNDSGHTGQDPGGSDPTSEQGVSTVNITVTAVNDAPDDITGNLAVSEFAANGTVVGTVVGHDVDGPSLTYTLLDNASGRFAINASSGQVTVTDGLLLDFEQSPTHDIQVQVTDGQSAPFTKTLTVTINDVNPENITGDSRANIFVGGALDDLLSGAGGNDHLFGQGGNDTLFGGQGDDELNGGSGSNTASYLDSASEVTVSLLLQNVAQNTTGAGSDTLSNIQNLTGSTHDDILIGDDFVNVLRGNLGNDEIFGRGGNDDIHGGAGNDILHGNLGNDVEFGGVGNDILYGGGGDDILDGGAGDDLLDGQHGGAIGSDSAGYLSSPIGVTVSLAQAGAVQNTVGAGSDTLVNIANLIGSNFDDHLSGDANANTLVGEDGNDVLRGSLGNDREFGGNGNDELHGGSGADFLAGGNGDDVMTGGLNLAGSDTFAFQSGFGHDVIADFVASGPDHDFLQFADDVGPIQYLQSGSNDTVVFDSHGNSVLLQGVLLSNAEFAADVMIFPATDPSWLHPDYIIT